VRALNLSCALRLYSPRRFATGTSEAHLSLELLSSPSAATVCSSRRSSSLLRSLTLFLIAMDISNPLMVVGTAERKIQIINLQSPTTIFKTVDSPLRWQTRVVSSEGTELLTRC
jgi:hypothetical protein